MNDGSLYRSSMQRELSLVAPVYDEEQNLVPLYERVVEVFGDAWSWELVLVDDGSRDGSARVIRELQRRDTRVIGVFLAHNCGQTTALRVGIERATFQYIATLDADLQNDPADLTAMFELLDRHDAVVGYREQRKDTFVRRVSSRIANAVRNVVTGDSIRDTGCALKIFRAEAIRAIPLHFEGMHRFVPSLLRFHGYSVLEHPARHSPRRSGASKYGILDRAFVSLADVVVVRWMRSRVRRVVLAPPQETPAANRRR